MIDIFLSHRNNESVIFKLILSFGDEDIFFESLEILDYAISHNVQDLGIQGLAFNGVNLSILTSTSVKKLTLI